MSLAKETLAVVFFTAVFTASGATGAPATTDGQPQRRGRRATGAGEGGPVARTTRSVRYGAQGTKQTTTDHPTSINLPSRSHTPTITTTCLASQPPPTPLRCLTTHTRSWGWVVKHRPHQPRLAVGWHKPHNQAKNKGVGPSHKRRQPDTHHDNKPDNPATPFCPRSHPYAGPTAARCRPRSRERRQLQRGATWAWRPATGAPFGSPSGSCLPKDTPKAHVSSDLFVLYLCSVVRPPLSPVALVTSPLL
jgi:hypothetical protein